MRHAYPPCRLSQTQRFAQADLSFKAVLPTPELARSLFGSDESAGLVAKSDAVASAKGDAKKGNAAAAARSRATRDKDAAPGVPMK